VQRREALWQRGRSGAAGDGGAKRGEQPCCRALLSSSAACACACACAGAGAGEPRERCRRQALRGGGREQLQLRALRAPAALLGEGPRWSAAVEQAQTSR